jgi:hypothetical protein
VSRACFGAAAIALVAAVFPSGAGAQSTSTGASDSSKGPSKPKVYSTATNATAVDYVPDQQGGLTPIKDATHMQFVTGKSTISSSNGPTAKATVVDPGGGATQGPANACPVVSGFIPSAALQPIFDACVDAKWPFIAQADNFSPDKSTDGSVGFGSPSSQVTGEGGTAHAQIDKTAGTSSTDSTMSGLKIAPLPGGTAGGLPLPPDLAKSISDANGGQPLDTALFMVGSIQSTTQNFFEGKAEVSHAESRLNGVRFIGGLMTIDSITSIADVHFTVDGDAVGTSSTTVQGAKVLGKPVTIDDKGVHPDGNSGADTSALQKAGLTITLVGATNGPDPKGFMTAGSEGLVVNYTREVQTGVQIPNPAPNPLLPTSPNVNGTYFVQYNLATVSSRAFARNLTAGGSSIKSSTGSFSSSISPSKGTAAPSGFSGGKSSAPAASLAQASGEGGEGDTSNAAFINVDFNLRWLYLAFTLAALGMCLAPRLAFASRLPGRPKA